MSIRAIETRLRSYEVNGEEVKGLPNEADDVIITAHHIWPHFVIIDFHGRTVTVAASDLKRAIDNATNHD
jgi:hypothetical protein